jgi:phosphotriesterase-related protein
MTTGSVVTVRGPVDPAALGMTLTHEHLFLNLENWWVEPTTDADRAFASAPVTLELLSKLRYASMSNWDNIHIDDQETVLSEVAAFKVAGGGTIVDVTLPAIGRDPLRLREVAERVDVHVVCGCGYYVESAHPPEVERATAEDLADIITRELLMGIDGTGVRSGVIGEIGTGSPMTPNERKVLEAAAIAHRRTGAPISIHLSSPGTGGHIVLDALQEHGVDLTRVALGHLDGTHPIDVADHRSLAARGAYVEYDLFGNTEFTENGFWPPPASDLDRIDALRELWMAGVGDQVLLSHDICMKMQQIAHGGFGFAHLPGHVAPFMRGTGFSDQQLSMMLTENPAKWLTWSEPND